jgi:hypothetical protein
VAIVFDHMFRSKMPSIWLEHKPAHANEGYAYKSKTVAYDLFERYAINDMMYLKGCL